MPEQTEFLRDIAAQPQALCDLVAYYRDRPGRSCLYQWRLLAEHVRRALFAGMGTSEYAAGTVTAALANAGVDACVLDAGELLHYPRPLEIPLVLISQSGESAETRQLAERYAREVPLSAITNHPESSIGQAAGLVLPLVAGEEGLITNKTYTNTLAVLWLMVQVLRGDAALDGALDALERLAGHMAAVDRDAIERAADVLAGARCLHAIARGPALASASEFAQTVREGARLDASVFTGGSFRHGPFELVDDTHHAVVFLPTGPTAGLLAGLARDMARLGSHVVAIADHEPDTEGAPCILVRVPPYGEALFPIACAIAHELLVDALARRRGLVAGEFRYGGKVTATE